MDTRRIIISGGPGTGKSSVIENLKSKGYSCFSEISRSIIESGIKKGIKNIFLKDPDFFSSKVLEKRLIQFDESKKIKNSKENLIFFDRSVFDVYAYQKYLNKSFTFPKNIVPNYSKNVFFMPPWKKIYVSDNHRLESYESSRLISNYIIKTYKYYGFQLIKVPKISIEERINYILDRSR